MIFRLAGRRLEQRFALDNGYIQSINAWNERAFALLVHLDCLDRKAVNLLESTNGGQDWTEREPVPEHASALLAQSENILWVLGVDTLIRSGDGGKKWSPENLPGRRDPFDERLALRDGQVLLLGKGIWERTPAGWSYHSSGNNRVRGIEADAVIGTAPDGSVVTGHLDAERKHVQWENQIDKKMMPFQLTRSWSKDDLAFLALPEDQYIGKGVWLFRGRGTRWVSELVPCRAYYSGIALSPEGSTVAISVTNQFMLQTKTR